MIAKLWSNFYCETSAVVNFQPKEEPEKWIRNWVLLVFGSDASPHSALEKGSWRTISILATFFILDNIKKFS